MRIKNVEFGGHCPREEILRLMQNWDAGLVPLMNVPLMAGALPSKMFEVMASGLPMLLFAPYGEASRLIESGQAGVWVPAEDPKALAAAVCQLAADRPHCEQLGRNGRSYVAQHCNRVTIAQRFVTEVESLLA